LSRPKEPFTFALRFYANLFWMVVNELWMFRWGYIHVYSYFN
jgi:hypothetical protein